MEFAFCCMGLILIVPESRLEAAGYAIQKGDLLLANYSGNSVLWITPSTEQQRSLGSYLFPTDLAMNTNGHLFISQWNGAVSRLNLRSGDSAVLNPGTSLRQVWGLALGAQGELYVTSGASHQVVRVDPANGTETLIAEGGELNRPVGLARWGNDHLVVCSLLNNRLVRVRISDGAQEVLAQGAHGLDQPWGVAVHGTDIYFTAYDRKEIQRWSDGQVSVLAAMDGFPYGLAASSGEIVVGLSGLGEAVARLSLSGSLLRSYRGGLIKQVTGIEIAPATILLEDSPSVVLQISERVTGPYRDAMPANLDPVDRRILVLRDSTAGFYRLRSNRPTRLHGITVSSNGISFKYLFEE